jgi:hypothetical protein
MDGLRCYAVAYKISRDRGRSLQSRPRGLRRSAISLTPLAAAQQGRHLPGHSVSNYQMREHRLKDRLGWAYAPVSKTLTQITPNKNSPRG